MAYSYDQVFAADPANPANIAANAAVLIYEPGDPTKTPLVITDPSGGALENPIIVNDNGFGSAFMHAALDRVAWDGGTFSGFFTSYDGMKAEAVAARTAAESAAATAGADAAAVATAAIGDATADAAAAASSAATSAAAAASAAASANAPADTAIATAVNNSASDTRDALDTVYAPKAGNSRNTLTGMFHPEGFGTVTYGKGVTSEQAQANAAALQAAIDAANNSGGVAANTVGGGTIMIRDVIEVYTSGATSALTLYSGVHLRGIGPGGNVFSGTDANLPYRGSVLRLWSGANQDLIRTANFATLTGVSNPSAYATPNRFGIYDMVLDGNKYGNSSGAVLKIFGQSFWLHNLVIQNGASHGLYTEFGATAGYDNEAQIHNLRIQDNGGDGWIFKGPHDSLVTNIFSARNGGSGFITAGTVGSLTVTNMHNWGNAVYNFDLGTTDVSFVNCVCDGTGDGGVGMRITAGNQRWVGGSIYGENASGDTMIQLGDGTNAATIGGLDFYTRFWNLAMGSVLIGYHSNVTLMYNVWRGVVNNNTNSRITAGGLKAKIVGAHTIPSATLNVVSTTGFPTSGSLYTAGGTVSYTGKTATSFTGVTGGASATQADGTFITQSTPFAVAGETYELRSSDGNASVNMQVGGLSTAVITETVGRDQIGSLLVRSVTTQRQTLASAGAVSIDAAKGNSAIITLNANATSSTISNPTLNQELTITWIQDATGGRTYVWPTNCVFAGGVAPSDTTASKRSTVRFWYDNNTSKWYESSRAVAVG